jgi:amino acid adenylation domain-containing protein
MLPDSQRRLALTSAKFKASRAYWERVIRETGEILPVFNEQILNGTGDGKVELVKVFSAELSRKIMSIGGNSPSAVFAIIATALAVQIKKYTDHNEVNLGLLVDTSDTGYSPADEILRCREQLVAVDTFKSLLIRLNNNIREIYAHKDFPSDLLEKEIFEKNGQERSFPIVLASDDIHPSALIERVQCNFLMCIVSDKNRISLKAKFDKNKYSRGDIEIFLDRHVLLLERLLSQSDNRITEFHLLSEEEYNFFCYQVNKTDRSFAYDTITAKWNSIVKQYSDFLAVQDQDTTFTYKQADRLATSLAAGMQAKGVQLGDKVALMFGPTASILISIIACFKCGAIYIPLDPDTPVERLKSIKTSIGDAWLITSEEKGVELFGQYAFDYATLKETPRQEFKPVAVAPEDGAYIIFTSGSTGTPKGVLLPHRAITNYVEWFISCTDIRAGEATILTSSYAFDIGYTSLFPAVLSGATLHFMQKENYLRTDELLRYIREHKVSYLKMTPSFLKILVFYKNFRSEDFNSVRLVVSGGERIDMAAIKQLFAIAGNGIKVINHYGPTETAVGVIHEMITSDTLPQFSDQPVIGSPVSNVRAYLLDSDLNPVPPGQTGHLFIGGKCLFKEYYNDTSITSGKVCNNPFETCGIIYNTGDKGFWTSKGKIAFVGREDDQVKVHGYRVELKEVEAGIMRYPLITGTEVIAIRDTDNTNSLYAFYTATGTVKSSDVKKHLSIILPSYMIPVSIQQLESFPLTGNGKVDLKSLRKMIRLQGIAEKNLTLQEIWAMVLNVPASEIKGDSNFFELGGYSILALEVAARVGEHLGKKISLYDIYQNNTLSKLEKYLSGLKEEFFDFITKAPDAEEYVCSAQQQRMYLLQKIDPTGLAYNKPYVLRLKGEIDPERLQQALRRLIARHEILRTSYHLKGGMVYQKIHEEVPFKLSTINSRNMMASMLLPTLVKSFNLNSPALIRSSLLYTSDTEAVLFIDMHHITSDAVSMKILIGELVDLYKEQELLPLKVQYKDYAVWSHMPAFQKYLSDQSSYWQKQLANVKPFIFRHGEDSTATVPLVANHNILISPELTFTIRQAASMHRITPFTILLAGFKVLLYQYTGKMDIVIGTSVEARPHLDCKSMVGNFINTIALRNQINPEDSIASFIRQVSDNTMEALDHQDYSFDQLMEDLNLEEGKGQQGLFNVFFELVDSNSELLQLEGLGVDHERKSFGSAKFDLAFYLENNQQSMQAHIEYRPKIFNGDFIRNFVNEYITLMQAISLQSDLPVNKISHDLVINPTQR